MIQTKRPTQQLWRAWRLDLTQIAVLLQPRISATPTKVIMSQPSSENWSAHSRLHMVEMACLSRHEIHSFMASYRMDCVTSSSEPLQFVELRHTRSYVWLHVMKRNNWPNFKRESSTSQLPEIRVGPTPINLHVTNEVNTKIQTRPPPYLHLQQLLGLRPRNVSSAERVGTCLKTVCEANWEQLRAESQFQANHYWWTKQAGHRSLRCVAASLPSDEGKVGLIRL